MEITISMNSQVRINEQSSYQPPVNIHNLYSFKSSRNKSSSHKKYPNM